MGEIDANVLGLLVVLIVVGLAPFLAVLVTAFAKIAVVLLIVRNALGVQQTPPNVIIYGVAIILSLYISAPAAAAVFEGLENAGSLETLADWRAALSGASETIKTFLLTHARLEDRAFFLNATRVIWGDEAGSAVADDDLAVLVPAFLVSELTRAFEIGFLIYLPFLAIDLIISAILMSLGMMMVSPIMIAVPFKLFLFIAADGWARLVQGLVLSYAPT